MPQSPKDFDQAKKVIDIEKDSSALLYQQTKATPDVIEQRNHINNRDQKTWPCLENRGRRAHGVDRDTLVGTKEKKKQKNYASPSDISTTKIFSLLAEPSVTSSEPVYQNPTSPSFYTFSAPFETFQRGLTHELREIGSQFNDSEHQIEEIHDHFEESTVGTVEASNFPAIRTESGIYIVSDFGSG